MSNQSISRGGGGALGGHATPTFGHAPVGANAVGYPSNISGPPLSPNRGMQQVQSASATVSSINQRPSFIRHHGGADRRMMGIGIGYVSLNIN